MESLRIPELTGTLEIILSTSSILEKRKLRPRKMSVPKSCTKVWNNSLCICASSSVLSGLSSHSVFSSALSS